MFQHFVMTTPSLMVVQAAEINSLVNTGGSVTTYGINASLPSGVSFGTNNGTIYGTPTELWTQTSYMVWANNSGGSSVAYLNITVVEELAIINILPSSATITRGYDMADINANNTGGDVSSWSISPALPLGLSLDNGTIQGRPLVNMSATTFTIYANNSGGSATATLTLTINEPTPNIEYSPDNHTLTNGTTYTITPTLLGQTGDISSILGGGTVSASGACTYGNLLIYQTNDYRVWAFNTSLSTSTSNPYVLATGVSFSNSCSGRFVYNGTMYFQASTNSTGAELWKTDGTTAGTSMVKDISSGTTSSYPSAFFVYNEELHFQIKMGTNGIDIWKTNGTSSGTVKATNTVCYNVNCRFSSPIEYNGTFYAGYWNNQGSEVLMYDSSGLSLLVDLTPGQRFSIPRTTNPSHLTVYDGWFWFLTNGNPQTGNGNCLYRSNGTAAGTTPFVCDTGTYGLELFNDELYFSRSANGKGYELWKTDGTMSGTVMVKDIVAGGGSALGSTATNRLFTSTDDYLYFSVHTGTANTDHAVWRTDGTAAGTELVKSSLVASTHHVVIGNVLYMRGQHFATDSDSILGLWSTDGTTNGTTMYTNYDGEFLIPNVGDLHNINGSLYLRYSNGTVYTYGQMSDAAGAIIGNPSSWSISPSLPAGLNFGTNNGTIWGTPSALSNTTQYNITATNANGTSTTTIRLTVIDVAPSVTYPTDVLNLTVNETSALLPFAPTSTGGDVTSWVIAPAGPAGLFFSSANGTIWGMPTELWNTTTYTIWANNSGGSVNVTFNLTVVDQVPTELAYADLNLSLTNNTAMVPSTPTLSKIRRDHRMGHRTQSARWPRIRYEQRNGLGDTDGDSEPDGIHHLGEQFRWLGQRDLQPDRRGSDPDGPHLRGPQPEPHEQHGHGPLDTDPHRTGGHHRLGDRTQSTCRPRIRYEQRYGLGDTDGDSEPDGIHHLGEQFGWLGQRDVQPDRRGSDPWHAHHGGCPRSQQHRHHAHDANAHGRRHDHGMVDLSEPAGRTRVRHEQRFDLGNADSDPCANAIHAHGLQFRWFREHDLQSHRGR